jgi:large subunit ribosomal protein L9
MKVILLETMKNLGKFGNKINIKPGYGRNYLIKYGKAVLSNKTNVLMFINQKYKIKNDYETKIQSNIDKYIKLKELVVLFKKRTSDNGKLYGSIAVKEIINEIYKNNGILLEKGNIIQNINIKDTGIYKIDIKLNPGNIIFFIVINVEKI